MKRFSLLITGLILLSFTGFSQADFRSVDSATYRLYTERKWDSLILEGKSALGGGLDYYYLRLRTGIAYFEKGKYISAANQLSVAREFNSLDPLATRYLYYAFLYSNQPGEARETASELPPELQKEIGYRKRTIPDVFVSGGMILSSENSIEKNPSLFGNDSLYGEKDVYANSWFFTAGLTVNISPRLSIIACYNYLNFTKNKYFQYGRVDDHLDSTTQYSWGYVNHYTWSKKAYEESYQYHVRQQQLYAGADLLMGEGFTISPAFQLINVRYNNIQPIASSHTVTDTLYKYSGSQQYQVYSFNQTNYRFIGKDTSFYNYVVSLMFTKKFSVFSSSIALSYSNLNDKTQSQAAWSLTCFPFGNLNLYGTTAFTGFFQEKDSRLIFSQMIGGRICRWLWAEGNLTYGDITNANLYNGAVVYNNSDKFDYMAGGNLIFLISRHFTFNLNWQYAARESQTYFTATEQRGDNTVYTTQIQNNAYHTNTITGGITWKF
jgi:hypothetical protein